MLPSLIGIIASSGGAAASTTSYESIATVTVGAGGTSTITFSSIPSTYTHLQIRVFAQTNRATYCRDSLQCKINGDAGTNYSDHYLYGDGGSAGAGGSSSQAVSGVGTIGASAGGTLNNYGVSIIDILDYTNTNKYKTIRSLSGTDMNGTGTGGIGGLTQLESGAWLNTAGVVSLILTPGVGSVFNQYSSFALYGIKG